MAWAGAWAGANDNADGAHGYGVAGFALGICLDLQSMIFQRLIDLLASRLLPS